MIVRPTVHVLTLLVGALIVLAACGPSGNATNPPAATIAPPATVAPATQPPTATEDPGFSFVLPSFKGDPSLAALLPTEVGGQALLVVSMTGDEYMARGAPELQAVLDALHRQPSDVSVAFGGNLAVTIIAIRIKDVPATVIRDSLLQAFQTGTGATSSDVTYGDKPVRKVVSANASEGVRYIYTRDDVVFTVGGNHVTDAILTEAFSKLP